MAPLKEIPGLYCTQLKGNDANCEGANNNNNKKEFKYGYFFLESENNSCTQARKLHLQQFYLSDPSFGLQGRPAQKSHHRRKLGEEKCSAQNGEKG